MAKAYKNEKQGEKENYAEAYKLAQTAIAIAKENPGCQTLVHEAFGAKSELGQWLIAKQNKQDQTNVREHLSQFSHAPHAEKVLPPSLKKTVISTSQALLLLIDHHQKMTDKLVAENADPEQIRAVVEKVVELKKLYLLGVRVGQGEATNRKFEVNEDDLQKMQEYLADPILSSYEVSKDKAVINKDPTRRYFETHLSYETVKNNIDGMDRELLATHVAKLTAVLASQENDAKACEEVFSNSYHGDSKLHKEYANYLEKIANQELFSELNDDQREKIILLVKSSLLGVANAQARGQDLPINIYNTAPIYGNWKGKEAVQNQETTENPHMGLMKNYMPIAQEDTATSAHPAPPVKPSDQSTYKDDEYAKWVEMNFAGLVHPFSNSISGTMLCQLRNLAEQKNGDKSNSSGMTDSAAQMEKYTQVFIAAMLYGSGGHSLNEYVYPLQLSEVRDEFADVAGFSDINLETLFLYNNEEGFNKALGDAITYNSQYLQRQRLNQDIAFVGAHQDKTELAKTIDVITQKIEKYESEVDKLFFSQHRTSREKLEKMKPMVEEITQALHGGNVQNAVEISAKLMKMLERDYGIKGFTGGERTSYQIAKEIHATLVELEAKSSRKENIITVNQNFKERLQQQKGQENLSINQHNKGDVVVGFKERMGALKAANAAEAKAEEEHNLKAGL